MWRVCLLTADKYSTTVKCNNDWEVRIDIIQKSKKPTEKANLQARLGTFKWNNKYFQQFKSSYFLCLVSLKGPSNPRNNKERLCVRPCVRYRFLVDGWAGLIMMKLCMRNLRSMRSVVGQKKFTFREKNSLLLFFFFPELKGDWRAIGELL